MPALTNNKLSTAYQGSANLYVIARRLTDGFAWNGSALEAYNEAALASYAIVLSPRGGDLYSADVPAGLPAGTYQFYFYVRDGATPSTADLIVGSPAYQWNGAAGTTPPPGSEAPTPLPNALVSLAYVKSIMRMTATSNDALLVQLINGVSDTIERLTNRQFAARDYRTRLNGVGQQKLVLPVYPIQSITRIAYGNAPALRIRYTLEAIRATASVYLNPESGDAGGVMLNSVSPEGVVVTTRFPFDEYRTSRSLVLNINQVAGWWAEMTANCLSADLLPIVANNCAAGAVALEFPDRDVTSYTVNANSGIITLARNPSPSDWSCGGGGGVFPTGQQYITVQYRGGYEVIPPALALIAADAVKDVFGASGRDGTVRSRTIGPFSETFDSGRAIEFLRDKVAPWVNASSIIGGSL